MKYNPEFDGLRAIAALLVIGFHAVAPLLVGGFLGVDIFFVLSGFLITRLLLDEQDREGRIELRRFYLKRLLRLTPPLVVMLALYAICAPLLIPDYDHHGRDALLAGLYLSDYTISLTGAPMFLDHTWSLAVEEHFYLIWPAVLIAAHRLPRERLVSVLFVAYAVATIWRGACIQWQTWGEVYYRFAELNGPVIQYV